MLQEQKPKKAVRKKPKPSAMTRPPKRNKKKKKIAAAPIITSKPVQQPYIQHTPTPIDIFDHSPIMSNDHDPVQVMSPIPSTIMNNHYLSDNATIYQYTEPGLVDLQQQEMFTVCENSSAYESSEDTGVGGLSESELMGASDGIGTFLFFKTFFYEFRTILFI